MRWLFDLLRGPVGATPGREGVWWKGLLVCAIDGTSLTAPDAAGVATRYTKQAGNHGGTGYPQLRVLALVACGTRALIDAKDVLADIAGTGADFLVRAKMIRRLPVLQRHRDGSYTSQITGLRVRVIDAEVTISTPAGSEQGNYRLITTLLDPERYRADQLVRLYHERWEIHS